MPASYPAAIYSPRTKENKSGVEYDPGAITKVFAEDAIYNDQEIVAIETELGLNPKGGYASVSARLDAIVSGGWLHSIVPSGVPNGTLQDFTLPQAPSTPADSHLFVNGSRQTYTVHFTISGTNLHLNRAPLTGSNLCIDFPI